MLPKPSNRPELLILDPKTNVSLELIILDCPTADEPSAPTVLLEPMEMVLFAKDWLAAPTDNASMPSAIALLPSAVALFLVA